MGRSLVNAIFGGVFPDSRPDSGALTSLPSADQDDQGFLRTTKAVKNALACRLRSKQWIKEVEKSVRVA